MKVKTSHIKISLVFLLAMSYATAVKAFEYPIAAKPDSAYVFAYTSSDNGGKDGLFFAWSNDRKEWHPIGPRFSFEMSSYSRWGSEKRMFTPVLIRGGDGCWHAVWTLNERDGAFAYTTSKDLINWKPQSYPLVSPGRNCLLTELSYKDGAYTVSWLSTEKGDSTYHAVDTKDFRTFSGARLIAASERIGQHMRVTVAGKPETGTIHKVAWKTIDDLLIKVNLTAYRSRLFGETAKDDAVRFAGLKPVSAAVSVNSGDTKKISDMMMGIFFEDINYAADGGIYAELVQNRGFEYRPSDRGGDKEWNSTKAWKVTGEGTALSVGTKDPVHENNPHYAVLDVAEKGAALVNEGFDGIVLRANEKYDFSVFARLLEGKTAVIKVRLVDEQGGVCGEAVTKTLSANWKKHSAVITATKDAANARLELIPQAKGTFGLDMVSLFPQKTFKGRKNGLRPDLAQVLADMKPRFVRFPGGCVAHGDGLGNIYHWKNTIGLLEARKPQRNLWGYHQSAGLGYFEYFQFCEDIGAEPLPIVAAGVPCQNSARNGCAIGGQQGGIPMDAMEDYIQDILDLVEWANGNPKTSKWAKMRADAGHPEPFGLKYIGVGNEDIISDVFEERFAMIYEALKEKYPGITVIGTAGPFSEGSDYDRGWAFGSGLGVPMLDEHYYQQPGWFIYNQDFYDRYDRGKPKVYLGEYAAHLPGRPNNVETALAEALHLISCERNGDVVHMTSYAPLLAKEGHTQWNPDLIYFNNSEVKPTVGYYVQKLYGENSGDEYISSVMDVQPDNDKVRKRVACSVVRDSGTGSVIVKLVNMLPVSVNMSLDMSASAPLSARVAKTTLTGKPDDRNAVPAEAEMAPDGLKELELPAYSFTVLRWKN